MGSGTSTTVLPIEKQELLSPASLSKFYTIERECFQSKLYTPAELHIYLTKTFEDLLNEDATFTKEQLRKKQQQSSSNAVSKSKTPKSVRVSLRINNNHSDILNTIGESSKNSNDENENSISRRRSTIDGHVVTKSKSKGPPPKSTRVTSEEPILSYHEKSVIMNTFLKKDHWTAPIPVNIMNMTDYECKVCQECFYDKELLEDHIQNSKTHANKVEANELKFRTALSEAEKVANLVRFSIKIFQDLGTQSQLKKQNAINHENISNSSILSNESENSKPTNDEHNHETTESTEPTVNKLRWKKAVSKVISKLATKRYEILVEDLKILHYSSKDVKLLYDGTKTFAKYKKCFGVLIYLHTNFNIIEIILQVLQVNSSNGLLLHDNFSQAVSLSPHIGVAAHETIFSHDETTIHQIDTPEITLNKLDLSTIGEKKQNTLMKKNSNPKQSYRRLYYDYNVLLDHVFGVSRNALEATHLTTSSNAAELQASKDASHAVSEVLLVFVLNRIIMDGRLIRKSHGYTESIKFDHSRMATHPEIKHIPSELIPVPIDMGKIKKRWEIKINMEGLDHHHGERGHGEEGKEGDGVEVKEK